MSTWSLHYPYDKYHLKLRGKDGTGDNGEDKDENHLLRLHHPGKGHGGDVWDVFGVCGEGHDMIIVI